LIRPGPLQEFGCWQEFKFRILGAILPPRPIDWAGKLPRYPFNRFSRFLPVAAGKIRQERLANRIMSGANIFGIPADDHVHGRLGDMFLEQYLPQDIFEPTKVRAEVGRTYFVQFKLVPNFLSKLRGIKAFDLVYHFHDLRADRAVAFVSSRRFF
jgi:hypothetical protein